MIRTPAHESAVAAAFAARLPTLTPTTPRASTASADPADAVVVSSVGEISAQFAAQILDVEALADGLSELGLAERLRPALEAAAAALGPGTLGEAAVGDASALFSDATAQVFDLVDAAERVVGRLAVRLSRAESSAPAPRLHRIAGVEMELTVEVGRTRMTVRDVLDLEPGRIVELDRSAGAPADVKLNGRLIAHGEIVVVDQDYAVRITRFVENAEV